MAKKYYEEQYINNAAIAIKNKLPNAGTFKVREFAGLINEMNTGDVDSKDINFYDYDGKRVYSYTFAEIQELEALPPIPSHSNLQSQSWNWTLAQLKAVKCPIEVGANYLAPNCFVRLLIEVPEDNYTVTVRFRTSNANYVNIEWGDDEHSDFSEEDTDYHAYSNTYATAGSYTIEIVDTEGSEENNTIVYMGYNISSTLNTCRTLIGGEVGSRQEHPSKNILKEIQVGTRCSFVRGSLSYLCGLEKISIPENWISYPEGYTFREYWDIFEYLPFLKCIVIPANIDMSSYDSSFIGFDTIKAFSIGYGSKVAYCPSGLLTKVSGTWNNRIPGNHSVKSISIMSNYTRTYEIIYQSDTARPVEELYMLYQTQVPTLYSESMNPFMKIYVPASLYEDWIAASGWSNYASQIIPVVL